jgi:ribosomal protein S6--L-glutamate ligase
LLATVGLDDGDGLIGSEFDLRKVDRVLLRTIPAGSLEQIIFRMDALQRLEAAGVPVVNPPRAMEACCDKYLASARLAAAGLCTPTTAACERRDEAMRAFDALDRDVVLKPLFGAEGKGITRITDPELAYRAFQLLEHQGGVMYMQRYIEHDHGDLRAFVLDGKVIAAMRRRGGDDWRANVSRGGSTESVELSAEQGRLAVEAAAALGALVAGVDLLPARDGRCYVLEVNAIPGWRGLTQATGVDVAAKVIEFLLAHQGGCDSHTVWFK